MFYSIINKIVLARLLSVSMIFVLLVFLLLMTGCASVSKPQPEKDLFKEHQQRLDTLKADFANAPRAQLAGKEKWPFTCFNTVKSMPSSRMPKVSLSFIEADLREVLLELSMVTSIPIVYDDTVEGIVSMEINNQSLTDTLKMALAPGGFTYRVMENYILVGSPEPSSPSFAKLAISCKYHVRHLNTRDIVTSLAPYYRQFVQIFEQSERLSITAPPLIIKEIQRYILNADTAPAQVKLELSVIEVSTQAMNILGVSWDGYNRNPATRGLTPKGTLDWSADNSPSEIYRGLQLGRSNPRTLQDSIHALQDNGLAEIKATPNIVTLSGQEANFSSTATVYLPYRDTSVNGTNKELTYGIDMQIIPHIADNNNIKLEIINASVSDFEIDKTGVPSITSHSVTNTVNVQNGEYLVLGGLLHEKTKKTNQGVPGLARVPGLGWLFGGHNNAQEKLEVLILIRPIIENHQHTHS